ncbi:universal stress protein [Rhodocytophaga aerolata]|uniref:Universal stress protein n=1 Tax=Rhodocytophaga aerolata TaxID=455078 RepID=A0ABT8R7E9_9BACT|nr:universal stress protein [Rhodocytophaga aerolata]MDO1447173.1 universal stress protein [Rhodocytophaga aerolata]
MKKILVPTDFSEQADNALQIAAAIAAKNGAEIHLLHVLDVSLGGGFGFNTMGEPTSTSMMDQVYIVQLIGITKKRLEDVAQNLKVASNVNVSAVVQTGHIYGSISVYAEEEKFDLIVMGTKGASGLKELLVGSNTERVVRNATCPVLSVKNILPEFTVNKIVFASNFESDQLAAVGQLKTMQELFNAHVHLVYINVPNNFVGTRVMRAKANEFVQRYQLSKYDFTVYDDNSEEEGIIHFAEEVGADIIAVATHGRTGLGHLLSGSIAEDIVNHANRPVLTFNLKS